jgi:hypothetical protein
MDSIDLFVSHWGGKDAMVPIKNQDITELESKLDVVLPNSYKYLLSTYGLIHTPNVLTQICDLTVSINGVQDFLSLDDVDSLSKLYQMSGMPAGHVVFASDCKGNMFCFKSSDCEQQQSDVPVWFFDQRLGTVHKVADSFITLLNGFSR